MDAWASERQYADHLAPIWLALNVSERGTFHVARSILDHAKAAGVPDGELSIRRPLRRGGPILAASFQDHRAVSPRPVVYLEHGAGQRYEGDPRTAGHGSYSGGAGHDSAILFLAPSETVANRWKATYPSTPTAVIGCPKLDPWLNGTRHRNDETDDPVVAVTFHPDTPVNGYRCPETRSAWPHFAPALASLAARYDVLGHAHPRLWPRVHTTYQRHRLLPVADLADVFDRADVLVVDNSSAALEMMALGRPVVWLNAPWYRRDVHHQGRFWEWATAGVQCDHPADLIDAVDVALADPPQYADARARVTAQVYAHTDGRSAARAVQAIRAVLSSTPLAA